ncbi:flagellar hook-basal body complex protein FliE [Bordetella hinzii]|nr:flagellar hook-basal body complex protein FliE [Bordetella hinzii]
MAVSGVSGIENMLQQMRAVVRAAQSGQARPAELSPAAVPASFAAELQNSIRKVSNAQNAATAQAKAFELGAPEVSLNDVMIDLQKASLGFQTAVQVRNRLVAAYKEISSMSI